MVSPFGRIVWRSLPAAATTSALIESRVWHADIAGTAAAHSEPLMVAGLALGAAVGGTRLGTAMGPGAMATAYAAAGGLATLAVGGYSSGVGLPLALWTAATAGVYALVSRAWARRDDADAEHSRDMDRRRLEAGTAVRVAELERDGRVADALARRADADALEARLRLEVESVQAILSAVPNYRDPLPELESGTFPRLSLAHRADVDADPASGSRGSAGAGGSGGAPGWVAVPRVGR